MSLSIRFAQNYTCDERLNCLFGCLQWVRLGWKTTPQVSESKIVESCEMKTFSKFDVKFDVKFENLPSQCFIEI
jgi:hypothetical protein